VPLQTRNPKSDLPVPLQTRNPKSDLPVPLQTRNPKSDLPVPLQTRNPKSDLSVSILTWNRIQSLTYQYRYKPECQYFRDVEKNYFIVGSTPLHIIEKCANYYPHENIITGICIRDTEWRQAIGFKHRSLDHRTSAHPTHWTGSWRDHTALLDALVKQNCVCLKSNHKANDCINHVICNVTKTRFIVTVFNSMYYVYTKI